MSPAASIPAGLPLLGEDTLNAFRLVADADKQDAVTCTQVTVEGPTFAKAWHIETTREVSPPWCVALHAGTVREIEVGSVISFRCWARSPKGQGRFDVFVRKFGHNSNIEAAIDVGTEWQEIILPFFSEEKFEAGQGPTFEFRFGFPAQVVEIGGIEVSYYGNAVPLHSLPRTRFSYAGREAGAAWREAAHERIETQRKSDFQLTVNDSAGKPIPGVKVKIEQVNSAFQFGAALQMQRLVVDSEDNFVYRSKVRSLFNAASTENDLKWPVCEGDWGNEFSHEQTLAGLRWLQAHGLAARGHVLVWPGWNDLPKSIKALRGTSRQGEIPELIRKRIRHITQATRGLLQEWDVINEPCDSHHLTDLFGKEIMAEWFRVAAEEVPGVRLYLNDFGNHDAEADPGHVAHFEETTRLLRSLGAPIGGLGIQSHMTGQPSAPERVLATLDRYAALHTPVRFTEFDIWTDDEELQADYTRDFLTLAYSHQSVLGVQFWGFWQNAHWRRNAALFRSDWSEKPNGAAYRELVLNRWRSEFATHTNATGSFAGRGFQGDYVITAEWQGRVVRDRVRLTAASQPTRWSITLH